MENIVEVSNLSVSYYTPKQELHVLDDISFQIQKGEIATIIGPSGSGKSTCLNSIAKLIDYQKGDIRVNGKIGYMFQKDLLLEWKTVYENILLPLEINHIKTKENVEKINHLIDKYNLSNFKQHYPHQLSGGMRQRVALIRTLALDCDILLLDEPFSALDYQTRLLVSADIVKIIRNENKTAIFVTHDISEAIAISDYVIILSKRPSQIKKIVPITLTLGENRTPLSSRKAVEFKDYFDLLWKELDVNECII